MNAYKVQTIVKNGQITVDLPATFNNSNVEVIVLQIANLAISDKPKKDMSKYLGIFKNKQTIEQIDEQLREMRGEQPLFAGRLSKETAEDLQQQTQITRDEWS